MTASDIKAFVEAVSKTVARQYPGIDYIGATTAIAVQENLKLIGWEWYIDGPREVNGHPSAPVSGSEGET